MTFTITQTLFPGGKKLVCGNVSGAIVQESWPHHGSKAPPLITQELHKLERGQRAGGKGQPGLLQQKSFFFKILTAGKVINRAVGLNGKPELFGTPSAASAPMVPCRAGPYWRLPGRESILGHYCKYQLFKMLLVYSTPKNKSPEDSLTSQPGSSEPGAQLLSSVSVSVYVKEKIKATYSVSAWKCTPSAACLQLSQ